MRAVVPEAGIQNRWKPIGFAVFNKTSQHCFVFLENKVGIVEKMIYWSDF
jgi:hypothetical protein